MEIFKPTIQDQATFSGSVDISGSLTITQNLNVVGELQGAATTASYISLANVDGFADVSSSIEQRISRQELFSGSLDDTFATDQELSDVSGALAFSIANISSDFADITNKPTLISSSNQLAGETIDGDLTITGTVTAQEFHTEFVSASIIYQSGSTKFGNSADDTHIFTGNIGIGNSNPSYKLDVTGEINATTRYRKNGYTVIGQNGTTLQLGPDSYWQSIEMFVGGNTSRIIKLASDGNVGIGTDSPLVKLDTRGSISAQLDTAYYRLRRTDGTDVGYITDSTTWGDSGTDFSLGASSANLRFYTNNSVAERMRIDSSGNVGIGTTGPSEKLHVAGNIAAINSGNTGIVVRSTSTFPLFQLVKDGGATWNLEGGREGNAFGIYESGQGTRFVIDTGGNVGINNTSPQYRLQVGGAARIDEGILVKGDYFVKELGTPYFTNGVANLACNVEFGNNSFWGYIEIHITGTYSNQNSAGALIVRYAIGTNPNNLIYLNEKEVIAASGTIADNIALGNFDWDSGSSQYVIPISHIVSTGNGYSVLVKMFTHSSGASGAYGDVSISSLYSLTALSKQYKTYTGRLGIGTTPEYAGLTVAAANHQAFAVTRTGNFVPALFLGNDGGSTPRIAANNADLQIGRDLSDTFTPYLTVQNNTGNVGIGTTSPAGKLEVRYDTTANNQNYILSSYRTGANSSYNATGLHINAIPTNNTGDTGISYLSLESRYKYLNGNHGTSAFITNTPGTGTSFGDGQIDFFIRNNTAPYTFKNDPNTTSTYWMDPVMTVRSDGAVLKPNLPGFSVYLDNSTTSNGNLIFTGVYYNTGNHYSTSSGRFTAPVAGTYFFYWGSILRTTSGTYRLKLHRNGSAYGWNNTNGNVELRGQVAASTSYETNASRVFTHYLNAYDYVEVALTTSPSSVGVYGDEWTYFGGYLLS